MTRIMRDEKCTEAKANRTSPGNRRAMGRLSPRKREAGQFCRSQGNSIKALHHAQAPLVRCAYQNCGELIDLRHGRQHLKLHIKAEMGFGKGFG